MIAWRVVFAGTTGGDLNAVVEPPARTSFVQHTEIVESRPVSIETVGHDLGTATMPLQKFLWVFDCRNFVPMLRNGGFESLYFIVYCSSENVSLAFTLRKNLADVPLPFPRGT